MHKDPPPGLFDRRRPVSHVVVSGLLAGFTIAVFAHFGWNLWRQSGGAVSSPRSGIDALMNETGSKAASPAASAAVRY